MSRVIVLGSLITDLVARAPRLPQPGETVLGEEFAIFLGGKGFNQAVAAARQGASVALIGQVGADAYGDAFFPALAAEGIDAAHVSREATVGTGVSSVLVGRESGQNMIVANPRANFGLTVSLVEGALERLVRADRAGAGSIDAADAGVGARPVSPAGAPFVFLAQCETPVATVRAGLRVARTSAMLTLLNVAPVPREPLDDDFFALVDILIPNETEADALTGIPLDSPEAARRAAEQLLARGCRQVVITLGAAGYLWSQRETDGTVTHREEQGIAVAAVDATAAGDAFCGALAAGLASGLSIEQALRRANAAGALAVMRAGALPSLPSKEQVDALLQRLST